jgi:FSR family fosmidomycin resistance protein-like MFS transporter
VVFAQELVPGRVGLIAGMFFGFAFGAAASALRCSASLPIATVSSSSTASAPTCRLLGLLTIFLPKLPSHR